MRLHWLPFLLSAGLLCVGGCANRPQIDETIQTDAARGSVYLERIPDPRFQAAHPIKLDRNLIARTLRGVLIRDQQDVLHTLVVGRSNVSAAFSEEDISFLAPLIEQALTRAAPDQQVGFRVIQSGTPGYSVRNGAAVGSSEPPLTLSPREFTSGSVYAYGRSFYLTLSEYRRRVEQPDTVNMPNRYLTDETGLKRRDILFTPDVALRADLSPPTFSGDSLGKTLVIDLQRLAQAPASLPPVPVDAAIPTMAPSKQPPASSGAEKGAAGEVPDSQTNDLESIKADMKKKNSELEDLRRELGVIKRQLDQQAEQAGKPAPVQKQPSR